MVYWGKEKNYHFAKILDCFPLPMAKAIGAWTEISLLHRNLISVCLWDKWGWEQASREKEGGIAGGQGARGTSSEERQRSWNVHCHSQRRGAECCWRSAKQSLCVLQTWWDKTWKTGRTWLPWTVSLPCFEGMPESYQFSSCKGRPFPPFLSPPDFVAEGGAQELETLWCFITGTLLEKCSPLGSDLVKAPTSAEIWCSHLGSS